METDFTLQNAKERASTAKRRTEKMGRQYANIIQTSADCSMIFAPGNSPYPAPCVVRVADQDAVTAAFDQPRCRRVCILNFASYKNPGGGFLRGSGSQEECLCHESDLYNILRSLPEYYDRNKENPNRCLYEDAAVYSPYVLFERSQCKRFMDVLSCSAPNFGAASEQYGVTEEENREALRKRIHFILSILEDRAVDAAILGAFGCGVFKQKPEEVASLFKEEIEKMEWKAPIELVFAIPKKKNRHYFIFRDILTSKGE